VAEPSVREVIIHLNKACATEFDPRDREIRRVVNERLVQNSADDMKLVNEWAAQNWTDEIGPDGKNWYSIWVTPSMLYQKKFGEFLGHAKKWKKDDAEEKIPWAPPAEDML